jgi:hypothetical protein
MPTPAPTTAPPNFYDNIGGGGNAPMTTNPQGAEKDDDGEVLKALTGCYRVLGKVAKLKPELKADINKIKDDVISVVVHGLKKDPSELESGEDKSSEIPAKPAAAGAKPETPMTTDETHAA